MDATQPDNEALDDLLVGAHKIKKFLKSLGMPESTDPYYLKNKKKWPIGKSGDGQSATLIASKRRLVRYAQKMAAPQPQKIDAT
jgi:hypothetical protein